MKTKTKKTTKKTTPAKRHLVLWPTLLLLAIAVVGYQVVVANSDSGLPLSAPSGTVQREAQLDAIEQQQEAQTDQSYEVQQSTNAHDDGAGLSHLTGVLNNAAQ